jgi:hypothetical protein
MNGNLLGWLIDWVVMRQPDLKIFMREILLKTLSYTEEDG